MRPGLARLSAVALTFFACAPASATDQSGAAALMQEYIELLRIPNVATDLPNIQRNADLLVRLLNERGLQGRLLYGGNKQAPPAVYGEWLVPGAKKTFVFYAHYDGQPVVPADWSSTLPFEPAAYTARIDQGGMKTALPRGRRSEEKEWRIYARSASDDKLGVIAILGAIDAFKAARKIPKFNVKIFFEGEEEAGSPHLGDLLARNRGLLKSDGWVVVDGPAHPSGATMLQLGVRGDVNVELTVYGPTRPLHSGHYGNWVPNPAMVLSRLLASLKDEEGRVAVQGFYDDVEPLSPAEEEAIRRFPSADRQLRDELGLGWTEGRGQSLLRTLMEPSLNINGIRAGGVGTQARNVIPPSATANLDLRLVKGNDVDRQVGKLVRHIRAQGFYIVFGREPTLAERTSNPKVVKLTQGPGYNAERTPIDDPLAKSVLAALAHSLSPPILVPSGGGSLPLYIFRETLGAPTVTVSLANHDNNQHGEDENVRVGSIWSAVDVVADLLKMQ